MNLYAYAGNNPIAFWDPFGLDAIKIEFQGYPVNTGLGFRLPLGHAAVIAIDKNGYTRYYEYGRYDAERLGRVERRFVPNVVMGKDGKPTQASLARLYSFVSENYGRGSPVKAEYHEKADYEKVVEYAERRRMENENKDRQKYGLLTNNCFSFAQEAVVAGETPEEK